MRSILAFICLLAGIAFYFLVGFYPAVEWIQQPVMAIVFPACVVLIAWLLILLQWQFRWGDATQVGWGVFAFAGCLLLVPLSIAREGQAAFDEQTRQSIQTARKELRLRQLRRIEEVREILEDRQERAKSDRFVQYEGRISADLLDKLREMDQRMLTAVEQQAAAYQEALDRNPTLGPEEWIRFRTRDQFEIERSAHLALYEQARAFTQFVESFEETYKAEIQAIGLQPPADRIAIAEMERILQDWERSRLYELRRLDVKLLGEAIKCINILLQDWGSWSYQPRERRVAFDNPQSEAAFQESVFFFQAIIKEVQMIRDQLDSEDSK